MDRHEFLSNVSAALGRTEPPSDVGQSPVRYPDFADAQVAADAARTDATARSVELLDDAADAMKTAGWKVHRAETIEDVGDLIAEICRDIGADTALRSGHDVLDEARIDSALERSGVDLKI